MKRISLFLVLTMLGVSASAHKDSIINVNPDGELLGLPNEFSPARLDLGVNTITIGQRVLTMPPCVAKYFARPESYDLMVTSSWYHQRSTLPPYINFRVKPKNKDFEYELLFSMNDLKPISFQVVTRPDARSLNYHTVEIGECRAAMEKATVSK